MRPKSHMYKPSSGAIRLCSVSLSDTTGEEMIPVRERKNQSIAHWVRSSILSLLGLLLAYEAFPCSAAESSESPTVFTNAQQILDLGIDKARSTTAPAVITG